MADETTRNDSLDARAPQVTPIGLRVVVAWHRDVTRIGATAWVPWDTAGDTLDLSRNEPVFEDGAPLADPYVSRASLQLVRTPTGLEASPTGAFRFDVDGKSGVSRLPVLLARVREGFRLGLGQGALLLVRLSPRPGPRCIPTLVGSSEELERLAATVSELAKLPGPVLIRGESGTGKELVAEALHAHGPRVARPFVAVNLAALAPSLAASQLFGHARRAYTGADRASSGFFGQAEGGTLFLDEVGACPSEVQALLLRALDSGELQVVGGPARRAEVRVVAATDADLERACAEGTFRAPLYHRLARHTVRIAPLRERPADVAVQAVYFARAALAALGRRWPEGRDGTPWLGRDVVELLLDAPWSGNSRELRATMERLVARSGGSPTCAPPDLDGPPPVAGPPPPVEIDVRAALAACDYRL